MGPASICPPPCHTAILTHLCGLIAAGNADNVFSGLEGVARVLITPRIAALPFCELGVRAILRVPKPIEVPTYTETLGGILSKRRTDLGLTRIQAARALGVCWKSLMWWERDERVPAANCYPVIISFLGYEPWPTPISLSEQLRAERLRRGLSIKAASRSLGVDEGTFGRWESCAWKPQARSSPAIKRFLTG